MQSKPRNRPQRRPTRPTIFSAVLWSLIALYTFSSGTSANQDRLWTVLDMPVVLDSKQKDWGVGALYVDIQQPNVMLKVRKIRESSLAESYEDIGNLRFYRQGSGDIAIDLSGRKDVIFINLPEGLYQITQIDVPHFDLPYKLSTNNAVDWRFRITPSTINYIGTLSVDALRSKKAINTKLLNQYAVHLHDLTKRIDESEVGLTIGHGAGYEDPFAEFLESVAYE